MKRLSLRDARGSVLVLTAVAMFPMAAMLAFAIDIPHWFDYSRNLQNRADAAALAAGTAYGNACFETPGDVQTGAQSSVGKFAQLFSGPGAGEPHGNATTDNVPYSDANVFAATGATSYLNVGNRKEGSLDNYFVRVNADNYAEKGGTNFVMGTFCNADPAKDATDKDPGSPGALADVKVTQKQVAPLIPIFHFAPNIHAHARVEVQAIASEKGVRPIAVRDATYTPCVTANFLNADGAVIASQKMIKPDPNGTIWTSQGNATAVPMPATNPVSVQLFLNNCSSASPDGITYDYLDDKGKDNQLGLVYINNWGNPGAAPAAGDAPKLTTGGSLLTGATCDPYYTESTAACQVGMDTHVAFQPPAAGLSFFVQASMDGGPWQDLTQVGATTEWRTQTAGNPSFPFTVPAASGPHTFTLQWAQLGGKVAGDTCKTNGNPFANGNKCNGTFPAVVQRSFAGVNGTNLCDAVNFDTGPIQSITVGTTDTNPIETAGANSFGGSSNPHLFVTASIAGLVNAPPNATAADDICLRVAEQDSHATGFVNCGYPGQPGGAGDQQAVVNGCPNVQKNTRFQPDGSVTCTPVNDPIDCVKNDPGQSPPILRAFDTLIGSPNCSKNWWGVANHTITLADPRAVVMIITAPTDMAIVHGTANIPIRDFAVFYVTGWSTGQGGVQGCSNGENDPAPNGNPKGSLWGHWTSIAVPSGLGTSNGQQCDFTRFGNCVAVLTR